MVLAGQAATDANAQMVSASALNRLSQLCLQEAYTRLSNQVLCLGSPRSPIKHARQERRSIVGFGACLHRS